MHQTIQLIKGWEKGRPVFTEIPAQVGPRSEYCNGLFEPLISTGLTPACGNIHAGKGEQRIIVQGREVLIKSDEKTEEMIDNNLSLLGQNVLISAGHFMPIKSSLSSVNSNSYKLLLCGIALLNKLLSEGKQADLLITINDVSLNVQDEDDDKRPTMSNEQRKAYYNSFMLPDIYLKAICSVRSQMNKDFAVYVIGENKLAERLSKEALRLADLGLLEHPIDRNVYKLPSYVEIRSILKMSHSSESIYDVYISNERGVTGRPKCVRACTKLAALPHEMGYTGFIQFLPVCSRNALEGFLIGTEIYGAKYGREIPYISVHNVHSCF